MATANSGQAQTLGPPARINIAPPFSRAYRIIMYVARRERAKGFFPPMARTAAVWDTESDGYKEQMKKTLGLLPDYVQQVKNHMKKFKIGTSEQEDIAALDTFIKLKKDEQYRNSHYDYILATDKQKTYMKDTLIKINRNFDAWSKEHSEDVFFLRNELLSTNVLRKLFLPQVFYEYDLEAASPGLMFFLVLVMGVVSFTFLFVLFWLILASIALNACINSGNAPQGLNIYEKPSTIPMTCGSIAQQCMIPNFMSSLSVADYLSLRVGFYFFSAVPVLFLFFYSGYKVRYIEWVFEEHNDKKDERYASVGLYNTIADYVSLGLFIVSHVAGPAVTISADMVALKYLITTLPSEPGCKEGTFTTANCACGAASCIPA